MLAFVYAVTIVGSAIGEWSYFVLGSLVEAALLAALLFHTRRWRELTHRFPSTSRRDQRHVSAVAGATSSVSSGTMKGVPTSAHGWVELWFGPIARTRDAAALVKPLLRFNRAPPKPWTEGDVDVLVVENQGVWLWGRTSAGEFVERENEPGTQWQPTGEDEEAFWLHHAAFEALWTMPASRSALRLDPASVSRLEDASTPLPCQEWSWPGERARLRHRNGSLAMICRYKDGFWVVVAGRTEEDLRWLDPFALEWDESDSRKP